MYVFLGALIMAIATYIPRAMPLLFFKRKIKSQFINSLLFYMPYAVIATMTFPGIFYCTSNKMCAIVGTIVAIIISYFEKPLITVALTSVASVYLLNLIVL